MSTSQSRRVLYQKGDRAGGVLVLRTVGDVDPVRSDEAKFFVLFEKCGHQGVCTQRAIHKRRHEMHRDPEKAGLCPDCAAILAGERRKARARVRRQEVLNGDFSRAGVEILKRPDVGDHIEGSKYGVRFVACGHEHECSINALRKRMRPDYSADFFGLCPSCTAKLRGVLNGGGDGTVIPQAEYISPFAHEQWAVVVLGRAERGLSLL